LRRIPSETYVLHRANELSDYNQEIGKAAAELIRDDNTIFFVGVSIVLEVARNITDKTKLTVITNSTLVIKLNSHAGITLVPPAVYRASWS
jgi:DeoR/GlpR family transcriptional regulator of sugar metabolism